MTTVRPRSCTRRANAASTSSAAAGSSADVGSSSTSTRGDAVSTAPMATRCCWPPESVRSDRSRNSCQAQEVDRVLDPATHRLRRHAQVLHGVRQFVLHRLGDEAGQWVLRHVADDVGQVAGAVVPGRPAVDRDRAGERAPAEVRDRAR